MLEPSPISSVSHVKVLPKDNTLEFIVTLELDSFALAIEPASMALVIPNAFTLSASLSISIDESSTATFNVTVPAVPPPVKPLPATTPVISASFVLAIVKVPAVSS